MALPLALAGFRFRTEVDWIKLRVTLKSPSQFRYVQDRMEAKFGKMFVESCDGLASSLRFVFTVQNPAGPTQVMQDLQDMVQHGKPAITERDVEVIGIEISLDAYIEGSDRPRLTEAVDHFIRHLARTPAGPMLVTGPKRYRVPSTPHDLLQAIASNQETIQIGVKDTNFIIRAYLKDYDTINSKRQDLPSIKHRARIEITLHGDQLPFTTIDSWRDFRFETMSKRFAMCTPDAPNDLIGAIQDHSTQIGRAADAYKRRPSDRRQRAPFTIADSVTNDKIRQALRGLTRRQSCQNSVKKLPHVAALPEGKVQNQSTVLNTLRGNPSPLLRRDSCCSPSQAALTPPGQNLNVQDTGSFRDNLKQQVSPHELELPLPIWGTW